MMTAMAAMAGGGGRRRRRRRRRTGAGAREVRAIGRAARRAGRAAPRPGGWRAATTTGRTSLPDESRPPRGGMDGGCVGEEPGVEGAKMIDGDGGAWMMARDTGGPPDDADLERSHVPHAGVIIGRGSCIIVVGRRKHAASHVEGATPCHGRVGRKIHRGAVHAAEDGSDASNRDGCGRVVVQRAHLGTTFHIRVAAAAVRVGRRDVVGRGRVGATHDQIVAVTELSRGRVVVERS